MIEHYTFAKMTIDGTAYTNDLLILPDKRVIPSWRRREGHRLILDDVRVIIDTDPSTLIVGTGRFGLMRPEKQLAQQLERRGITLRAAPTARAVVMYNRQSAEPGTAACFHLTC